MDNIALQLWSVKDSMEKDVEQTLKAVSGLGFKGVEFAGFFDVPAEEMRKLLDKYSLKAAGSHTDINLIVNEPHSIIEYNKIIGNNNIVCPHYPLKDEKSLDELCEKLEEVSGIYRQSGMKLYYHNHNHEFFKIGGKYALDLLFERLDFLKPQIDTYWVFNAGVDIGEFCLKYKGRCDLIHLKDGTKTESFPVGEGEVDIPAVLDVSRSLGAEWVIMEDETWKPDGLSCVARGMNNLKKITA